MATKSTIANNTFMFTGTLTSLTRAEAERLVKENGGTILSGVTAKLNILVVGEDTGSKLEKAKKLGTVKILTEKEFLKLVPKAAGAAAKTNATKTSIKQAKATKDASSKAKKAPSTKTVKQAVPKAEATKASGIAGKTFYFLDIFTMKNLSTQEGEELVEDAGGIVVETIDSNLDYLVHNTKRGDMSALMVTRLQEAIELGVKVINEGQLLKLLSTDKPSAKASSGKKVTRESVGKPAKDERFSSLSLGSTENQITSYIDSDRVDFANVRRYVQSGVLSEEQYQTLFEEGGPFSSDPEERSYLDFYQIFNPEVLFVLYKEPFEGTVKVMFGQDPSEAIYEKDGEEYGRLYRNMHLTLDRSQSGLSIRLEREHYYDYDNIDVDDELMKEIEQVEEDDQSNKGWDELSINLVESMELAEFKNLFYTHFKARDIYL